jgi:hypothetical protein
LFNQVNYKFLYAGENLAVNFSDSGDVINAWMNSPSHRSNILNHNFTETGIATAQGTYNGQSALFVVQLFGQPSLQAAVTSTKPVATTPAKTVSPVVSQQQNLPINVVTTSTTSSIQEMFVAIRGAETQGDASQVAVDMQNDVTSNTNIVQKVVASPNKVVSYILITLGILMGVALILGIFIKIRIQHPRLIFNGLLFLLIIGGVLALNYHLFVTRVSIM